MLPARIKNYGRSETLLKKWEGVYYRGERDFESIKSKWDDWWIMDIKYKYMGKEEVHARVLFLKKNGHWFYMEAGKVN